MKSDRFLWRRAVIPALFLFVLAGAFLVRWPREVSQGGNFPEGGNKRPLPTRILEAPPLVEMGEVEIEHRFEDGGVETNYHLALDEVVVRPAGEKSRVVALRPPATRETYATRLKAFAEEGEVMPVIYPEGEERTIYNRRLVTSEVLVEAADGEDRAALPGAMKLPVEMMPEASPGHVVVRAPSPLAALAGIGTWRVFPGVKSAEVLLARQHAKRAMPNDPLVAQQWHLKFQNQSGALAGSDVNVEPVWNYPSTAAGTFFRGAGIHIGIVDDGLQTNHPDLEANVDIANDRDWNDGDYDPTPGNGDDHGTACAGNAAAIGNNGRGVSGTAPEAKLVGMRLIADSTTDSQEADAMGYLNNLIHIKSNSWGPADDAMTLEGPGTLTRDAFAAAVTNGRGGKGTIFLWAGGNGGEEGDNSNYDGYANLPETIAIGATDSRNRRAWYSEPGANVIVCAPSSGDTPALGITTVDRTGGNGYNTVSSPSGDYTDDFGGTSSATPTAAGIVALMLQRNPDLGWRDVQEILIRSAKRLNTSDTGWGTNGAGFRFHHDFGAGLIDAQAAVSLAGTWTNLATRTSAVSARTGLALAIPNNSSVGATQTFSIPENVRAEHVTVRLSATHTARGNLEVTLTSPTGMESRLAEVHADTGDHYSGWTFMSARHWGEAAAGTWTLKVADRSNSGNSTGGTLTAATLTVFGTPGVPVNPAPVVRIVSPESGSVFSPGATLDVTVEATDTVIGGGAGVVASVALLDNGSVIATKTSAPFTFTIQPSDGGHTFVARATDSQGTSAESASVTVTLANRPPVISAATIGDGFAFDDTAVTVTGVSAADPDGTEPVISYQWQSSADGVAFQDVAGLTSATLPPDPSRSGLKWRCALAASDGSLASGVFITNAVNLLDRPLGLAAAGTAYAYQSGLVLRSGGGEVSRDAIINEFSQGPSGSNAEWVEILTLRQASLRNWVIKDKTTVEVKFADSAVWDAVPAGTRIVVYNAAERDPLLPADDADFSDGAMILASDNSGFFSTAVWPSLGNGGDAISLLDGSGATLAQVGYGNDAVAAVNVGSVGGGRSAHYAGGSDQGAGAAANWRTTTSLSARKARALVPGVALTNGSYSQDFNTTPGASGTAYPQGWTSFNSATEDAVMTVGDSTSMTGANYNYGAKIGLAGSGGAFNTGSLVLALDDTGGPDALNISYDIIKVREQTRSHDFRLEYSLSSPTSGFVAVSGGNYVSGSIAEGTVTSFTGIALPAEISDRSSTVYLRWLYTPSADPGTGGRDGLALDNVVISQGASQPSLSVGISPSAVVESAGPNAATGTVLLPEAAGADVVVSLVSSDESELTVPATVTIPAGMTSAAFAVAAVDDNEADGPQSVTVTATSAGYSAGSAQVSVTDDEVVAEGVTPGQANTVANAEWIATLQAGTSGNPALFRLADGSALPAGLVLDAATGLISGTIGGAVNGTFAIVIERYNSIGEIVSQSFTLEISGAGGYAGWISGFEDLDDAAETADPDGDGLPNLVEYFLGLLADTADATGALAMERTAAGISLTFTRDPDASGIVAQVEWSETLAAGSWSSDGVTEEILTPGGDLQRVKASLALAPGEPRKFIRLRVTRP